MPTNVPRRGRVVAIMPARNSAKTLEATVARIPPGHIDQLILVDNASKDDTVAIAERLGITVVRHQTDRGFGGSIKSCFRAALAANADYLVELHPDNQYDPAFVPGLLDKIREADYAMVMGSRFLPVRRSLDGGMPWWKFIANRFLSFMNGAMMGAPLSEYHSGLRVYSARWARTVPLDTLSNDFVMGFQLVAHAVVNGWALAEAPADCLYFKEASMNPLIGSTVYGWGTLKESFKVLRYRLGLGGPEYRQ